jgi:hypothetical protein
MTEKELKNLFQSAKDIADTEKFPVMRIILLGNGGVSKEVDFYELDEFSIRLKVKKAILDAIGKVNVGGRNSPAPKTDVIQFE